tara:strand:+ start:71 stop:526 length:456 start_codon:yes stop_codon:yes gene_type:complete
MASSDAIWGSYLDNHDNYAMSVMGQHLQKQEAEKALAAQNNVLDFTPSNAEDATAQILEEVGEPTLLGQVTRTGAAMLPFSKTVQKGMTKTAQKALPKVASKVAMRGIPYAGWALAGLDLIDAFSPEGYGPYNLFGLVGENPVSDWLSWRG